MSSPNLKTLGFFEHPNVQTGVSVNVIQVPTNTHSPFNNRKILYKDNMQPGRRLWRKGTFHLTEKVLAGPLLGSMGTGGGGRRGHCVKWELLEGKRPVDSYQGQPHLFGECWSDWFNSETCLCFAHGTFCGRVNIDGMHAQLMRSWCRMDSTVQRDGTLTPPVWEQRSSGEEVLCLDSLNHTVLRHGAQAFVHKVTTHISPGNKKHSWRLLIKFLWRVVSAFVYKVKLGKKLPVFILQTR